MRFFYLLLLVVFVAAVAIFAYQNNVDTEIKYLDNSKSLPLPALIGIVYGLGMLTGWTVVGLVRRTFRRATEERHH
ncbi:MAG TPA: LapA family protein [Gemmataceae bacterium]|nr:LapA family protein [Gemmataceae bacterium]